MRVLLINKYHRRYAGPERLYFDTAKLLEAEGHEVAFFSMADERNEATPFSRSFAPHVEYENNEPMPLGEKIRTAYNLLFNFTAKRRLEELIRDFEPDVAHMFNIYHQLSPSIIWALHKHHVPMVMTLCDYKLASPNYNLFVRGKVWHHSSGFRCLTDRCVKDSFAKSLVCVLEQWLHQILGTYGKVDVYLGLSQFLIATFKDLGFPYPIQLLPQPLFLENIPESPLLSKQGKMFLYFGRLSSEKGVATLIRAFEKLTGGETLSIVGFGPEEETLKTLTQDLGLEKKVTFLGPIYGEGLQDLLRQARAVVVPSEWYENTPYALLEALASGTPVIASRIGSLPEIIKDGENGLLFEPGQAADLAQKTALFLEKDTASMEQKARDSVAHLKGKSYLQALENLYSSLIQAKK